MWPWGHLAVGYLAYAGLLDYRFRRPPDELAVVALAVATQLPDVVDKPLAWYVGVIPNGRSLAHSALIATAVVVLVGAYFRANGRPEIGVAFGLGYYSHLAGDAIQPFLAGRWAELAFLGWPVLPAVEYTGSHSLLERFGELFRRLAAGDVSSFLAAQFVLVVLTAALWASHGYPGLGAFRRAGRLRQRSSE